MTELNMFISNLNYDRVEKFKKSIRRDIIEAYESKDLESMDNDTWCEKVVYIHVIYHDKNVKHSISGERVECSLYIQPGPIMLENLDILFKNLEYWLLKR